VRSAERSRGPLRQRGEMALLRRYRSSRFSPVRAFVFAKTRLFFRRTFH
jgi:hypothetical protein